MVKTHTIRPQRPGFGSSRGLLLPVRTISLSLSSFRVCVSSFQQTENKMQMLLYSSMCFVFIVRTLSNYDAIKH